MKKITLLLAMIVSFFGFSQIDIDFESNGADSITAAGNGTATAIVPGAGTNTTLVASLSNAGDQYENYPLTIDPVSLADASQKIISVDFYNSTDTSRTVSIKLEGPGVNAVLVSVASDATAGWETLEFDFSTAIIQSGCYCTPIDASGVYTTMILFVNIGEFIASETAIDNISGGGPADSGADPVTTFTLDFETNGADFIAAAGNGTATAIVPGAGTNTTLVASLSNAGDQYENYPITLPNPIDLSEVITRKPLLDFYNSTNTSRTVSIKLEGPGVQAVLVSVDSDATAGWETLEFDFTTAIIQSGCYCTPIDASGVYTTMILFVNIGEFIASETAIDNLIFRDSTFSTNDVEQLDSISYFPNPVINQLTIKAQSSIDSIQVYNLLGQSISTSTPRSNQTLVDTSTFNKGAYFVKVSVDNKVKTIRFIKN